MQGIYRIASIKFGGTGSKRGEDKTDEYSMTRIGRTINILPEDCNEAQNLFKVSITTFIIIWHRNFANIISDQFSMEKKSTDTNSEILKCWKYQIHFGVTTR